MHRIFVHVVPNAKQEKIMIQKDLNEQEILKIRVTVPPIDGKANKAVIDFLARHYHLPKSSLKIVQGQTWRQKVIEIKE